MFFVQEFRSRLEEKRLHLSLGHQAGGSLMLLKNVVVLRQAIDVRQSGTLSQEVSHQYFFSTFDSWCEFSNVLVEIELAFIDQPQNRSRGELHGHGGNMEAHIHRIRGFVLPVSEAVRFFKNNLSVFLGKNGPAEVSALHVRPEIDINA